MDALDDPVGWVAARPAADPVQRRVLEALARRAGAAPAGALREALVARLLHRAEAAPKPQPARRPANAASPLTELLARLQHGAGPELRHVQAHRRTWSALRLARCLAEVDAPPPEQLGPLHSQVLVRRALQQLKALSPAYLQSLVAQLDGLAALQALTTADTGDTPVRRVGGARAGKPPARKR
ncbi:DUF2894 domain-containing protein [Roseateles saccharophilus]|uniref:DUF2894 family protein n=1 Tax=Roseateles saccharophilus TaxID=304 RepID=A0A4R3VKM1_ROSSA|nr:DUF2894 domain-containing protein [Roseateles saccharophilus]MDG0831248.1 DUF2894 domain-containing protein [Roseateles saccharophilus]TCV04369.1 DUF2894 family protein [Roseateles saccharophilus]